MTPSPSERRAHGIAVREARLARVSAIRRRAVASALALFVATWLLIAMLLVTGHDPALARSKVRTAASSAATTSAASNGGTTVTTTTPATTAAAQTTTAAQTSSSSPSALTSSQS